MPLLDTYRFICTVSATETDVTPVNEGIKFVWELEGDGRFYRRKMPTTLLFRKADYTYFKALYDVSDCQRVDVRIENNCSGDWATDFSGYIALGDANWNYDRKEVEIKVEVSDADECIIREIETEKNWLMLAGVNTIDLATLYGAVETTTCTYAPGTPLGNPFAPTYYKACWSGTATQTDRVPDPALAWRPYEHTQTFDPVGGTQSYETTWARETITQVPTPPGFGWVNLGANKWVRPVLYSNVVETSVSNSTETTLTFSAEAVDITISNGKSFNDCLAAAVDALACDIDEVVSNFFGINPDGTEPANDAYTFAADRMQNVLIFQKSDIVNENASNDATILTLSLKQVLDALRDSAEIYWAVRDVAGVNTMYIEHYSYFEGVNGLDLTTLEDGKYIVGTNKFDSTDKTPAYEVFSMNEAYLDNFLPLRISYPCGNEKRIEKAISTMATDVGGLLNNSRAGLVGFVLVATATVDADNALVDNYNYDMNGAFSWVGLGQNLLSWNRYNTEGYSNIGVMVVQSVKRRRQQAPLTIPHCCDDTFTPDENINTGLGWGQVKSAEHDTRTGLLTLTLIYE